MISVKDAAYPDILNTIADEYSRNIILSIITKPKSIEEIAKDEQIPISTCYRRVRDLETHGIIRLRETVITEEGKKIMRYGSSLKSATISIEPGEVTIDIVSDVPGEDMLRWMWFAMKRPKDRSKTEEPELQKQIAPSTIAPVR